MRNPGEYTRRLGLQQPSAGTPSATGEVLDTWVEVARLWAKVQPVAGREFYLVHQVQSETTHLIYTPYRADVTFDSTMRLKELVGANTIYYHIESAVDRDYAHQEFEIRAIVRS